MNARLSSATLRVLGTGRSLPGPPVTTADLLDRLAAVFGIPVRTGAALARLLGIHCRHFSRDFLHRFEVPRAGARNPELAAQAVQNALASSGTAIVSLQYLLGHTATPARPLPPNIAEVAARLNHFRPYAELRQACTGFANALQWAAGLLAIPNAEPVAIVGSEVGSVFFDPDALKNDREQWVNLMQMGDGAGAIVLAADDGQPGARLESCFFGHLGSGEPSGFCLEEGGSDFPALRAGRSAATFQQNSTAVKQSGAALFHAGLAAARDAGIDVENLAAILPHQANGRIGDLLAAALSLPPEMFYVNADHVGNLGSAAVWVALDELRACGRLQPGDRVLILGAEATQYMYGGFVYVHG